MLMPSLSGIWHLNYFLGVDRNNHIHSAQVHMHSMFGYDEYWL
jgi:hypothetical protein